MTLNSRRSNCGTILKQRENKTPEKPEHQIITEDITSNYGNKVVGP